MAHMILTLTVTLIFFLLQTDLSVSRKPKGSNKRCVLKEMDRQAEIVFVFGRRDVYLPKNPTEMVPHCKEEFDAEDFVKSYSRRCLKPLPRQIIGVILMGASQVIKQRCTPEGTKEYLSHYDCIYNTIPHLHDCMDQLVVSLHEITKKPVEERIPQACCSFSRYISCSVKPVRKMCPKDPTAEDYVAVKMIKGYASEVLDMVCQGYDLGGEKCNKITLPDGGFKDESGQLLVAVRNVTDRPHSIIPPFMDIFTTN
ncbi:uncharacterized protein LOC128388400 [Panonychus citri]|uniref:uncharacterized protein LOC128385913 n=1 Tax=Panonychus citri TaxID=50023 RepID=UPI0023080135|nr:uncharacterized protein LOC128385913 [Panonychus citri]XP_053203758.1 uncharacterized protein LOC128388400 [Panonychus citri]XP_053203759.1 uncharacterized protein LOC128388400 [Panonychus citri]XP_053203760.1 uncharacterized protein LOC128388400 [Panonychus citri]